MEKIKIFRIMNYKICFLITIFSLLLSLIKAQMEIISPENLKQKFDKLNMNSKYNGEIEVAYANYGKVPLGKSFIGRLFYFKEFDGCQEDTSGLNIINRPEELSIILVKSNGRQCEWTDKSLNIEKIGGRIALISSPQENYDFNFQEFFIKGDYKADLSKSDYISIPTLAINKKNADELISLIENFSDDKLIFKISFDPYLKEDSDSTNIEISFGSGDIEFYKIIQDVRENIFNQDSSYTKLKFFPKYINYKHPYFNETFIESHLEDCICGGRYCVTPKKGYSGNQIILENIRQQCIYDFSSNKNVSKSIYFDYMNLFYKYCIKKQETNKSIKISDQNFNSVCSKDIAQYLGIPLSYMEDCVDDSFVPRGISYSYGEMTKNKILEKSTINKKVYDSFTKSQIFINNKFFIPEKEISNINSILNGVCISIKNKPDFCEKYAKSNNEGGNKAFLIIFIIIGVLIFNIFAYFACKRYMFKRLALRIQNKDLICEIEKNITRSNFLGNTSNITYNV